MRTPFLLGFCLLLLLTGCYTPRIEGYEVHGIDVSHYQGDIDWGKVKEQHIHFVFIKASEGEEMGDAKFAQNWEGARAQNIRRGAYHYYIPTLDPIKQADNFLAKVVLEPGDLPPVLDVEASNNLPSSTIANGAREWCTYVEQKTGVKPMVYSSFHFYNQHLAAEFDMDELWLARYNHPTPGLNRAWSFWQYTDKGGVEGIDGYVDLNVFSGDSTTFAAFQGTP